MKQSAGSDRDALFRDRSVSARHDRPRRFEVLDSWRGVAALIVAFLHVPIAHGLEQRGWFMNAQMAVDFFFVLSGFVISHAYLRRLDDPRDLAGFALRRAGRVWPLHAAALACLIALEIAKLAFWSMGAASFDGPPFSGPTSVPSIFSNLLLAHAFNLHGTTTWNGPGWSISAEAFAYLVFGVAALAVAKGTERARVSVFAGLSLYGLAGLALLSRDGLFATHDFGVLRCLYGFFTGCLAWQVWLRLPQRARPTRAAATALEIAALTLAAAYVATSGRDAASFAAPIVAACVVLVFSAEAGAVSSILRLAPFRALGRWSYSIYMVHMLVFAAMKIILTLASKAGAKLTVTATDSQSRLFSTGHVWADAGLVAIALMTVTLASAGTWRWIEAPAQRFFNRLASRIEQRSPAAPRTNERNHAREPASFTSKGQALR